MSATLATPGSAEERAIVWERVATSLQSELNDAHAIVHRWQDHVFEVEANSPVKDAAIDELERIRDAQAREVRALRATNGARERTIIRQLRQIADLHKRLPRVEQHTVTPAEAFRALHAIETVIGAVVDLTPIEDMPANQPLANAVREAVGLPKRTASSRGYLAGMCPFCKDDSPSPSLVVRPYYGQFSCYACGAAGDVIRFLELYRSKEAA